MQSKESSVKLIAYTTLAEDIPFSADSMPVLAARVSHAQDTKTGVDPEADKKLMQFLADHKHYSPFEHVSVTFLVECPLFIRSEWHRHRTQSFNEVSMRYTEDIIGDVWLPDTFRQQATRNKQSSAGVVEDSDKANKVLAQAYAQSLKAYYKLLELGVAREQARAVIPAGHMTKFYATANMRNWSAFCDLRLDEGAQYEIRTLAKDVSTILRTLLPNSWGVLQKEGNKS